MTYQPLARKYRPQTFAELVGQEAVAQALAGAIRLGREPHALIFAGVRGIGKTTTARLYAKALNCENGPTPEPCNVCESCVAITAGRHEDVIEIDGASNNGVGEVRALQETVEYVAQRSKFKIYIIDEVHMLSVAAFNALLKTLEEPPPHVVFVFATTELQKVPETIVSRCPTFFLKKLPLGVIRDRLTQVLEQEGIPYEPKAVGLVAREGHGSMRDALTLLDQAIALGEGKVTVASLEQMISSLSSTAYLDVLEAAARRDGQGVMTAVERLDQAGVEFPDVCEEVARYARHAFVIKDLGKDALDTALLGLDDEEVARLDQIAEAAGPFDLNRLFRTLVRCRSDLSGGTLDRYIFENYLLEWCFDPGLPDLSSLMEGASSREASSARTAPRPTSPETKGLLQSRMAEIKSAVGEKKSPAPLAPEVKAEPPQKTEQPQTAPAANAPEFPATWRELVDRWKALKPLQARKLEEVHILHYSRESIRVAVDETSFASKSLLQKDDQREIARQFADLFGFAGQFDVIPKTALPSDAGVSRAGATAAAPLPETLLETRAREAEERRSRIIQEVREAPLTREILSQLGGSVESVRLPGDL